MADCYRMVDRGYIREGFFADLVEVAPSNPWSVTTESLHYKCGWAPVVGRTFQHQINRTFVSGSLVYELGKFNPGTQDGVPQRVYLTIPIKFTLADDEEEVKLSKMELWQIEMDGKYICTMLFELAEAQKSGDLEKMSKLSADFEIKATALEKRYAKGTIQEKELERIVQPCLDEATKSMSGE